MRKNRGFTLLELLVVMGIIALLAAIVVSFFGNVRRSQRRYQATANMRIIHNALRQYQLDENGLPPFHPDVATIMYEYKENGTAIPDPASVGFPGGYPMGLWALVETGALETAAALHDPQAKIVHIYHTGSNSVVETKVTGVTSPPHEAFFYASFQTFDPAVNEWIYMPYRDISASPDPLLGRRQLWPSASGLGQQRWMPAGSTVVLWSPWHRLGQDNITPVLYWDGSLHSKRTFVTHSTPAFIDPLDE